MRIKRVALVVVVLLFPCFVFAQNNEKDAKDKLQKRTALVEQVLSDVNNLKLGENRALVYARAGSIIWPGDQKRALGLYQDAVNELINAQALAESSRKADANQNELLTGGSTRPQVLNAIASHDAELALEMLIKTRPAAVSRAMAGGSTQSGKINNAGNAGYLAQTEFNMEQSFARMAADQDPQRAEKLIKDSISKGISNETLNLLKKLAEKNSSGATELASQVIDKLMQSRMTVDGQPNYQNDQIMIAFLNEYTSNQNNSGSAIKFSDSQMRGMADRLINYYLEGGQEANWLMYSITPIAEKFAPGKLEQVKAMAKNAPCRGMCGDYDPDLQTLMSNGETTPEQLIAATGKAPGNQRVQLYEAAANKYVQQGNMAKAREVISDNFGDDSAADMMRGLDSQYSYKLMNEGRFGEAESIMDAAPENTRITGLTNLANAVYQRDPEKNKAYALSLIGKARELIGDVPENSTEFSNLMQIVNALINIDPTAAFRTYETLVPQMNELSDAAAVINGFQGGGNVRSGEFLLSQGNSFGYYGADFSQLRTLADKNFDRATKLIDGFSRREVRISLKLQLAEGLN